MAKDSKYTGESTKIAIIYPEIATNTDVTSVFGVDVKRETVKNKKGNLVLLVAEVPKQLADEMVKCERARLYKDAVK